jgi:hypothetical protein
MDKRVLKLLYRSLDSALKKKDQERLDKALAESKQLRQYREDILSLRQAITQGAARSFRPQFEERVMSRIRSAPFAPEGLQALLESYRRAFRRVVLATFFILVILFSYAVTQDGLLPKDAIFYVSQVTIDRILQVPVF